MNNVINLRQARKSRARTDARRTGDANAAKFGRTKAEVAAETTRKNRASKSLDGHRIDKDDPA
ncbi:MAG: DUF4169 family protein [Paracoccus sp. (in: a-proteobacteria)]|uniref:DUF4169 family protein n=1 Tax=Paracoccus sp. TaxID=267 RepID=UPI0026DF13E1|nr:DUF4169 family protein [Paracoccus sp. (in: a-proteobacteria)]MDO5613552.1 DUF4169 family protein [Paracoccus sp. (in: a-proteobacteria)]